MLRNSIVELTSFVFASILLAMVMVSLNLKNVWMSKIPKGLMTILVKLRGML